MRSLTRSGGPWLDGVLIVVLAASLVTLAVLQHRFTTAAAETERQRLRAELTERLRNFQREADRATSQAVSSFWVDPEWVGMQPDWRGAVAERVAQASLQWRAAATFPRLLGDVSLVVWQPGANLERLRVDAAGRSFEPVAWPQELAAARESIARRLQPSAEPHVRFARVEPLSPVAYDVLPGIPAFVLPVLRDPASRALRALLLVRLDRDYMAREWLPALAARHFPGAEHELVVRAGGPGAAILYTRGPHGPDEILRAPDAGVPLLTLSLEELEPLLDGERHERRRTPARSGGAAGGFEIREPGPPGGTRTPAAGATSAVEPREEPQRPFGPDTGFRELVRTTVRHQPDDLRRLAERLSEQGWQLRARHAAGSIDAAARRTQRQNLLLGYGVLLLLAASLGTALLSARRARRLARREMEFVAGVSHELRTPVAVIRALSSNMADGLVRSESQVALYGEHLGRESRRLGDLVERTLEYAGISSGRRVFSWAPVDPCAVVRQALEACAGLLRDRGTRVEVDAAADLPALRGDAEALVSVVRNLVENASHYSAPGSAVRVGLRRRDGFLELSVADTGSGIDARDLRRLFEPFFRGANAARDGVRGVGIGLTLARRIVEAHGGEIRVASRPGVGSTFTVRLPLEEAA